MGGWTRGGGVALAAAALGLAAGGRAGAAGGRSPVVNSAADVRASITPTWTGQHTFTADTQFGSTGWNNVLETPVGGAYASAGDFAIASNAVYVPGGGTPHWNRIDVTKPAYLLEFRASDVLPGESVGGVSLWVCQPGANPILTSGGAGHGYGAVGGWENGWIVPSTRDMVVGGSIEMDGHAVVPYGRALHNTYTDGGAVTNVRTGILTNVFADFSGRDAVGSPSWFAGRRDDGFVVQRLAGGGSISNTLFADLLAVDSAGGVTVPHYPSAGYLSTDAGGKVVSNGSAPVTTESDPLSIHASGGGAIGSGSLTVGSGGTAFTRLKLLAVTLTMPSIATVTGQYVSVATPAGNVASGDEAVLVGWNPGFPGLIPEGTIPVTSTDVIPTLFYNSLGIAASAGSQTLYYLVLKTS